MRKYVLFAFAVAALAAGFQIHDPARALPFAGKFLKAKPAKPSVWPLPNCPPNC